MKNSSIYIWILFLSFLNLEAQVKVNSEVELIDYPSISLDISNRNPNFKTENNYNFFKISGSNQVLIDSVLMTQVKDTVNYSKKNKCVLILVESINNIQRIEQVNTFFRALENSIPKFVNPGDLIQIASFHLRQDNTKIINLLHTDFTDDIKVLKDAIGNYDASKNKETKVVSEIPGAILEGIDLLVDVQKDYSKSILLLSEERTNKYSTQRTFVNVIKIAQEKDIVINTIKYNRSDYRQHTNPILASETYGESNVLELSRGNLKKTNPKKQFQADTLISYLLNNVVRRSGGTIAKATLVLEDVYSDGREQQIIVKELNSPHSNKFIYNAPGNWYFGQFQTNPFPTICSSILLIILILLVAKKIKTTQKANKLKLLKEAEEQKENNLKQQTEILNQKKEIDSIKKLEQVRKNDVHAAQLLNDKNNKEAKLLKQMKAFGDFPILKFSDSKNSDSFEINKPLISFGRDKKSNDIHISNLNISRTHFSIIFEASDEGTPLDEQIIPGYRIIDNDSTNGMIINGYKLKRVRLKHGDIIEIADATFTFYL
tara:strand:- start:190 stop:1824 length:1635 start_codon:yes stop_codon:yes gene_type:complete